MVLAVGKELQSARTHFPKVLDIIPVGSVVMEFKEAVVDLFLHTRLVFRHVNQRMVEIENQCQLLGVQVAANGSFKLPPMDRSPCLGWLVSMLGIHLDATRGSDINEVIYKIEQGKPCRVALAQQGLHEVNMD